LSIVRSFKPVLLLLLLLLAVAALWAVPPASAHSFHSETELTVVLGEQIGAHVFESPGNENKFNCPVAQFQGTKAGYTTSQLAFDVNYQKCTLSGTVASPVTMNGCRYVLHGETDANEHGRFEIACETGKFIQIDAGTLCTVTIVPQTVQGVHYVNEGTGTERDLRISLTASGLWYEKKGFFCGSVLGNGKDLQITGTFTAWGNEDFGGVPGEQVGFWVE
jgi:hypothetical protein